MVGLRICKQGDLGQEKTKVIESMHFSAPLVDFPLLPCPFAVTRVLQRQRMRGSRLDAAFPSHWNPRIHYVSLSMILENPVMRYLEQNTMF